MRSRKLKDGKKQSRDFFKLRESSGAGNPGEEFTPLERINDNYPKFVLTMDKYFDENRAGIQWQNLVYYLASP
jgi:hypothetical protein